MRRVGLGAVAIVLLACGPWSLGVTPVLSLDVPPLTGRVMDLAHLLPPEVVASLSADLAAHEQRTGHQIALLTIPSLEGDSLEDFSHRVATTWKLGRKGADTGVLLLVVPGDRRVRIEVGYGLEGRLTDARVSRIIRHDMAPRFRTGDFPGGITAGLTAIMRAIEGTEAPPEPARDASPADEDSWGTFVLAALIGTFVGAMVGAQQRAVGGLVGGALSFFMAVSLGLLFAAGAAAGGLLGALALSSLFGGGAGRFGGPGSFNPRLGGWPGGGFGGWGGGLSGSGGWSGGGGDFGGGGASGNW